MKKMKFSKLPKYLKVGGVVLVALIVFVTVSIFVRPVTNHLRETYYSFSSAPSPKIFYEGYTEMAMDSGWGMDDMAVRSSSPIVPPVPDKPMGDDAEDFEVTEYSVFVETGNVERDCEKVFALKDFDYVIFESATEYKRGCYFTFKVEVSEVDRILDVMENLEPKDFSRNTYTIKRSLEYVWDEREVLEKKREAIEKTLEDALIAYEEITKFARENRDSDALARVIDSKIQTVERLTRDQISIGEQLNRLAQSEVRQMDRLGYTHFYVDISELKIFNFEDFKDSWKESVRQLVSDFNEVIQGVSVGLLILVLFVVQYVVYILLLVFVAKFVWKGIKKIWRM